MVREYDGWRWLNDDPRRVAQPPAVQQLHRITAPTLIVVGAPERFNDVLAAFLSSR